MAGIKSEKPRDLICAKCGKSFTRWPCKIKPANINNFCSRACKDVFRHPNQTLDALSRLQQRSGQCIHAQRDGLCLYCCHEWQGTKHSGGYGEISISGKLQLAHRNVWEAHNKQSIPDDLWCLHRCHNRRCVNPLHLYVGTQSQNMRDREDVGTVPRGDSHGSHTHPESRACGERNGHAILTEEDVRFIRDLRDQGLSWRQLSEKFGVTMRAIRSICARRNWRHVA